MYERTGVRVNGLYHSDEDTARENTIAARCEEAWHCVLHRFPATFPVDWYAQREDSVLGFIEAKARSHPSTQFPTVWLSLRKWHALVGLASATGVPGLFVVAFTDDTRWVDASRVDASALRVAGRRRQVWTVNDVEPVIDVPVLEMAVLR